MRPNTLARIAGQSTRSSVACTPSRLASPTARAASAATTSIFDGIQPRFRHVPPKRPGSTIAVRRWSSSAPSSMLPLPAPRTIRS